MSVMFLYIPHFNNDISLSEAQCLMIEVIFGDWRSEKIFVMNIVFSEKCLSFASMARLISLLYVLFIKKNNSEKPPPH
jgi:hypothetical protein